MPIRDFLKPKKNAIDESQLRNFTDEEIHKSGIRCNNLILCIKALASATYQGIWNEVAKMAIDIHDTIPNGAITQFLIAFGVDFGEVKE